MEMQRVMDPTTLSMRDKVWVRNRKTGNEFGGFITYVGESAHMQIPAGDWTFIHLSTELHEVWRVESKEKKQKRIRDNLQKSALHT